MSGTGAYDSQIIGHVCVDVNVDVTGAESRVIGGAAACAAGAAVSLGHRVEVVTAVGEGDEDLLSCFPPAVERIIAVPSRRTTSIRNVYRTQDRERRVSHGLEQGDPIGPEDVPDEPVGVRHLAGLIVGDYAPDMVDSLFGRGDTAVDMQAFLRVRSQRTGELDLRGSTAGEDFFGRIRYLKVDAAEGEALTGLSDRRDMARALRDRGAREVMVSGPAEMLVLDDSGFHSCPLRPRTMVGRTGRGDTVFSAYITERLAHGVPQALLMACATVSLKMERPGPLVCERREIEDYLRLLYSDLIDDPLEGDRD